MQHKVKTSRCVSHTYMWRGGACAYTCTCNTCTHTGTCIQDEHASNPYVHVHIHVQVHIHVHVHVHIYKTNMHPTTRRICTCIHIHSYAKRVTTCVYTYMYTHSQAPRCLGNPFTQCSQRGKVGALHRSMPHVGHVRHIWYHLVSVCVYICMY